MWHQEVFERRGEKAVSSYESQDIAAWLNQLEKNYGRIEDLKFIPIKGNTDNWIIVLAKIKEKE